MLQSDLIPGAYCYAAGDGDEAALIIEARFILAITYSRRIGANYPIAQIRMRDLSETMTRLDDIHTPRESR